MRVVSLFSGAGGLDLGFKLAGNDIVWANDIDENACATYRENIGDHIVCEDIKDIDIKSIPAADIVIGGFPCQGFSLANLRRSIDDERNQLYKFFYSVIKTLKPKFFVAENVKGILSLGGGSVIHQIEADFQDAGYMSCARVKQCSAASIGATERHNERLNTDYANVNVVQERIPLNVHYRSPPSSYMETLRTMEAAGTVSTRGLRKDATLFDEIIIDVNTMYFERNGGYEYAKKFYEEAYHFLEKKFGSEYVVAAVMHADEINKAATSDLGKDVYHYHLHAVVIPVVDKDILWSKRCKDPALRGTVRETIHQVSHSKKWASNIPLKDEQGQPVLRSNGKSKYRPSYSILQDELVTHMQEHGFMNFQRGELGSTRENLTSLQYQIEKDKERLANI